MRPQKIVTILSFMIAFMLPLALMAQPGNPGPDPDPQVPIDGGLSLLVAAGIGYAAKRAHDKKKEKAQLGEK
jgi:hypothetical protein